MSSINSSRVSAFRRTVWDHWKKNGRHDLPWRRTKNPYRILVSEVMLQQTQVSRVIEKYKSFLKRFPTIERLASSSLASVLQCWSGLGYNRRAKYLHDAAKIIVSEFGGNFKQALQHPLPGVGPYTRAAVRVFAFNEPETLIETNIRATYIYHLFSSVPYITDREIKEQAAQTAKGQGPREWHWALMDYGAHLKRSGVRNNHQSAHYTKQSKFEGSLRQVRGEILRALMKGEKGKKGKKWGKGIKWEKALAGLERDGLIVKVSPRLIGLGPKKGKPARPGWRIA